MPSKPESLVKKLKTEKRVAGGAATGGGINFQATVTAIAYAYMLRGRRLGWLDGLQDDVPVSVAAETGGGGDDIQLILRGGKCCDVQVKRGLRRGEDLWKSLLAMGAAISEGKIDFGVLVVSSSSSKTIREELANAIPRIGDGRTDNLSEIAEILLSKLKSTGLAPELVCQGLRIVTVSAAKHDRASIAAAEAELGHVCRNAAKIGAAWNVLYRDAIELIDHRGRRELSSLVQLFKANDIAFVDDGVSPAAMLSYLTEWMVKTNVTFSIFGVRKPLRLSEAWIPLHAIVREEQTPHVDLMAAINAYQSWHDREYSREAIRVDPETLGRFIKLGVLVAGPGMGKTTLLSRIAQAYAADGIPVLRVRLAAVAARMHRGETFEEAVFALGLAGSAISPNEVKAADIRNWVLLCDGLDETGAAQAQISSAAEHFTKGHPDCRVIVTTRPVGYHANDFADWRHYDIVPLERKYAHHDLARLLCEIGGVGSQLANDADKVAKKELKGHSTSKAVTRSPLLLALAASVIARGGSIGVSRSRLYEQLFALVDDAPNYRIPEPPEESAILRRFLDILGWQIVSAPIASVDTVISKCAEVLVEELELKPLVARAAAQSYLRYWQDVGLIERVTQQETEALTFLHKTFGEFAAARFLTEMSSVERSSILSSIRDEDNWNETLDFAAMLGMAEEVCAHLMDGVALNASGIARVVRCLDIFGEAESDPSKQIRAVVLDYAIEVLQLPRRQWAAEIGIALLPVARRFPNEVAPLCTSLISHSQSWTRLAAWATLAEAGLPDLDFVQLQAAICEEPLLAKQGMWASHSGGLVLGSGTERDLAQAFVLAGVRQLLKHYPGNATDQAVVAACRTEGLGSVDFLERASRLLKEFGISDNLWPAGRESALSLLNPPEEFLEAQLQAHTALFDAIDDSGDIVKISSLEPPKLLNFSAFLNATSYLNFPISDVWEWQEPFDPEPVRETLRAAIEASGIPQDVLEHEVRIARNALAEPGTLTSLFQFIADVDVPPMDWKAASACNPDLNMIEAALYHGSAWIVWVAAHLLEALAQEVELQSVARRAISSGHGDTLWAAAGLAVDLDKAEMTSAIYDRLQRDMSYGCSHLLLALPKLKTLVDPQLQTVLEAAFLHGTLETAMAASEVATHYAAPETTALLPVLARAAEYWKIHEEPPPKKSGVVPDSPRAKIAEASAAITLPTYETLKIYAADPRSDMRKLGEKMLVSHLVNYSQLASTFLTDIESGNLHPRILDKTLTRGVSWEADCLVRVCGFLSSLDSGLRYAAITVLQEDYCPADVIRREATRMTNDPDQQVKERAYRILDMPPPEDAM